MQRSFKAAHKVLGQAMARARARVSALLAPMQWWLLPLLRPALALLALTLVLVAMLLQLIAVYFNYLCNRWLSPTYSYRRLDRQAQSG